MLFTHLKYFVYLVEMKSYTKAAELCFVSQSTISKAVSKLEEELTVPLVNHRNPVFELTKEGELLYDFAKDVTEYYDEKEGDLLSSLKDSNEILRLGLPPTAGSMYFYSVISYFQKNYGDYNLKINTTTSKHIPDLLLEDELDVGVVIEPFTDDRFVKQKVYESEAVLIVSEEHPLAKEEQADFAALAGERFLQISKDYQYYWVFQDYCRQAGFEPNIVFENYSWDMILEMVASNRGVSVLPKPLVQKFLPAGTRYLHLVNPEFPWAMSTIYLKNTFLTPVMKTFLKICMSDAH